MALIVAALFVTSSSSAATPTSGIISEAAPVLIYDAGPFNVPNQSPLGASHVMQLHGDSSCRLAPSDIKYMRGNLGHRLVATYAAT